MALLATVDQLAARLQVPAANLDSAQATQALTDASGMVRAISGQQFDFVQGDTVDLDGRTEHLTLPQRPAVIDATNPLTVVELADPEWWPSVDTTVVEGVDFVRLGNRLRRVGHSCPDNPWRRWMWRRGLAGIWAPRVRVTYSHGYQQIPADVVAIVLDVAQVIMSNPFGLRQESIGDYGVTYATETLGSGMVRDLEQKLAAAGRNQRSRAFSVRLG